MIRKILSIGLITAFSVAGLSATSEAGHHHRRARHGANQNCGTVPMSQAVSMNSGCSTCSTGGYSTSAGQPYGAMSYGSNNYGNAGVNGNQVMQGGQGFLNANGNLMGGRVLGR